MSQPEKDPKTPVQSNATVTAMGLAWQIGCVVPVIILLAVLGGVWLDKTFKTEHIFTLALLFTSFPLSIFLIFQIAMRAVRDINRVIRPSTPGAPVKPDEEKPGE